MQARSVHFHEQDTNPHPQYSGGGVTYGTAADLLDVTKAAESAGVSLAVARADHKHDIATAIAGALAFSDAAAEGTATTLARSDHKHSAPANPFPGYGTSANLSDVTKAAEDAGVLTTVARADHKHDISTATASVQAFGDTAAEGTATSLARSDHKHTIPANPFPGYGIAADLADVTKAAELAGVLITVARSDHKHDITTATASVQAFGDAAAEGTATSLARSDHKHTLPANPVAYGTTTELADVTKAAESAGVSALIARADHKHDVTTAVTGAILAGDAAAEGTATTLARSDHKHSAAAFAAPTALTGSTEGAGAAATIARSDHTHRMPKKRYRCTADTGVSTTAPAAVTGWTAHALTAGKVYEIRAPIWYTSAAATTGPRPVLVAAGGLTATDIQIVGQNQISATTVEMFRSTALGTAPAFTASVAAGGLLVLEAVIKVNVAGTIQLMWGSEVAASLVTVIAGSYFTIEEVAE